MAHKALKGRRRPIGHSMVNKKVKGKGKATKAKNQRGQGGSIKRGHEEGPSLKKLEQLDSQPVRKHDKKAARLEHQAEKQHRGLYPGGERVLLVGEGNFSFARALCETLGTGEGIYATGFDGESILKRKFPDANKCRKEIEDKFGGTTLVGVDATRLHSVREFKKAFSKIVFNFPHIGAGESDVEKSITDHQELLAGFFTSAAKCLDPERDAHVHVALKVGEPYKSWKVVQIAKAACPGMELVTAAPFSLTAWPGYAHRRTIGFDERFSRDDSEELAKGAKVYIFVRRKRR